VISNIVFELSRFLQVESVKLDGEVVEFIHNPAVGSTQLSRRGNDLVAVILPERGVLDRKSTWNLSMVAKCWRRPGSGCCMWVARGTWYPNRGWRWRTSTWNSAIRRLDARSDGESGADFSPEREPPG